MAYPSPVDTPLAATTIPPAENSAKVGVSTTAPSRTFSATSAMSRHASNSTIMSMIMTNHASLTSTTPPTEDSRMVDGQAQLTSSLSLPAEDLPSVTVPALLTPSTSATTSEHAPSPSPYEKWTNVAKDAHYQRAHIFGRTRQMMRHQTKRMLLTASRGYGRAGNPPTKATNPPMRKRRHSIDVVTKKWGEAYWKGWEADHLKMETIPVYFHEVEPVIQRTPNLPLPNPCRYQCFGVRSAENPPDSSSIYLELGTAVIHNDSFRFITNCDWPEAWMRDESLSMALEVLRRDQDCDKYSIGFADSNMTQTFQIALTSNDTGSRHYDSVREDFGDKKWIFLTINDGSGSLSDGGTHWSLVAMDRVHKQAHYIDSLFLHNTYAQNLGRDISLGLLQILGENVVEWYYNVEWNSPHQKCNNLFNWDSGPCGPVVYTMTKMLVESIKCYQDAGQETECSLRLPKGFGSYFGQSFHSLDVRNEMACSITRWKVAMDSQTLTTQHDQVAVAGSNVALLNTPDTTLFGPEFDPLSNNSSESVLEYEQDEDGGVALNDESNFMVISTSGSEFPEASAVLSDSPHHIELDDASEAGEVIVVLEDVILNSHPRLLQPSEYRSLNRPHVVEDVYRGMSGNVESASATPTAPRVHPKTPHHAAGDHEAQVQGQILFTRTHGATSRPIHSRPTTPDAALTENISEYRFVDSMHRRRRRRRDSDTWSTNANP